MCFTFVIYAFYHINYSRYEVIAVDIVCNLFSDVKLQKFFQIILEEIGCLPMSIIHDSIDCSSWQLSDHSIIPPSPSSYL